MLVAQKTLQKPAFTPFDRIRHRQKKARQIAARLETSALLVGDAEALAVADCIRESAEDSNLFYSFDQVNFETGESFDGIGALDVAVSSRFCPIYQAKQSARARRVARAALAKVTPVNGERLRFVTLTMPNLNADFKKTADVFDYAVSLLKKRVWFKSNVRGGVFGSEFTVGAADNYHFHAHAVLCSRWLNQSELAEVWTHCVRRACDKFGIAPNYTKRGLAIADVRLVKPKASGRGTIALDDAVNEVCKYLAKGSDIAKIPVSELCDVERVLRRRQLLKTFGECNERKGKAGRESDNDETPASAATSLDTRNIIDAPTVKIKRAESLVKFGSRMIKAGRRDEWLSFLRSKMSERRAFRRVQLARTYPMATFWTLDGRTWSKGEEVAQKLHKSTPKADQKQTKSYPELSPNHSNLRLVM